MCSYVTYFLAAELGDRTGGGPGPFGRAPPWGTGAAPHAAQGPQAMAPC